MRIRGAARAALASITSTLTSIPLALGLIAGIIVLAALSTVVPQGMDPAWYGAHFPPLVAAVIRAVRFDVFFRSAVFLGLAGLLVLNLGFCTVTRVVRRAARHAPVRVGPDLVHLGLLVLAVSGIATGLGRREQTLAMVEGDAAGIGSGYHLALRSLQFLAYADGSPRDWISTVGITREGRPEVVVAPIRVNHPLRLPGITVYQSGWDVSGTLRLRDKSGAEVTPPQPGDYFRVGDSVWVFAGFQRDGTAWSAAFNRYEDRELVERRSVRPGDSVGPFTVEAVEAHDRTGLKVVHDPGLAPFLAALLLVTAGMSLTFLQKRRDPS
ncbi:MAG TPA: cytochrome c biogenesis protein ResB [Spirochaetia bacterium]|nr:cytochrome c biogenesis protein ResB [Spirochaetia bacterium]